MMLLYTTCIEKKGEINMPQLDELLLEDDEYQAENNQLLNKAFDDIPRVVAQDYIKQLVPQNLQRYRY